MIKIYYLRGMDNLKNLNSKCAFYFERSSSLNILRFYPALPDVNSGGNNVHCTLGSLYTLMAASSRGVTTRVLGCHILCVILK